MQLSKKEKPKNILYRIGAILQKNSIAWPLLLPAVLCLYFFILRPQVLGTYWSLFNMQGYTVKEFIGLDNYKRIISDTNFIKTLWNTCQYVLWSLVLGYPVPIIVAAMLNEIVHFRNSFRFVVYLPSALPGVAVIMLWYLMFYPDQGGLLNILLTKFGMEPYVWLQDSKWTIFYIVISMTWNGMGGTALYYFAAMQGVNRELYEACVIDGGGYWKRFRHITLPSVSGISLLFLVKQIIGVFSITTQPLQMTDGGPNNASMTMGLLAYRYGFVSVRPQLAMTVGVIMFLILMVFTCFYFYLNKRIESNSY